MSMEVKSTGSTSWDLSKGNDVYTYGRLVRLYGTFKVLKVKVNGAKISIDYEGGIALPEPPKDPMASHPELPNTGGKE